ncbi:ATP-binding protein [Streptomyces sp. NBC_00243]|uniref:sensor histidine kinase n=1 Tax=Streptomyces sp. NBC_00243 TaxID=2975688 RepID=UPI002DDB8CFF|nr:ATP-binding protein [Streptomyces sp. NBC_00243]WRZ21709.1 ATP-binding protein [Streptomyces sp. NBC_00243]
MTAPIPSGERPTLRAVAPAPLITAVLAALAVTEAVYLAPGSVRVPLAWGAGAAAVLLCAAVAVAAYSVQTAKLVRRRLDAVTQDAGRLLQERARLTEEFNQEQARLTGDVARERARLAEASAQERVRLTESAARERARLTEEFAAERQQLTEEMERLAKEHARQAERARQATGDRAAALASTANAAGRMQALSTGMLADLRAMEERHSDEEVLADLLHLDHRTAQAGRLADSVAVLSGARSGRRWARPIVMESILRGAMGRIGGYQRVRVHSASEAAVAGHAAEGVMHALAELLDNAANFSPPTAEVHVYVEEVPAGVIVSVEDSGLVMGDVQLRRAERAVSGDSVELGGLTGTRLGLAVVGRLARKHSLKVSFRPSARGGTGVLMLIPQDLLTLPNLPTLPPVPLPAESEPELAETELTETVPAPEVSYAAARAADDLDPDPVPTHDSPRHEADSPSTGGLPKRRRGRTLAHAERSRAHVTGQAADAEPRTPAPGTPDRAKARADRFSSFRQAVRATAADTDTPTATDATDDDNKAVEDTAAAVSSSPHSHSHPEGHTTP